MTEILATVLLIILLWFVWEGSPTRAQKLDAVLDYWYKQATEVKQNGNDKTQKKKHSRGTGSGG